MFIKIFKVSILVILLAGLLVGYLYWDESRKYPKPGWSTNERSTIASLWLGNLYELPEDPSNTVADDTAAARLGQQIFFDKRFSGNGEVACVSCHDPDLYFTDGKALSVGMGVTGRSAPTIVGTAYHPFIFWDGRADSQWAQALGPMESVVEHGGSRMQYVHLIASDPEYSQAYESLFGSLPDLSDQSRFPAQAGPIDNPADPALKTKWEAMSEADRKTASQIYANLGKAIAAYERLLIPGRSRFDAYARAVIDETENEIDALSHDEIDGLRLFIGKGRCIECHNGPLFSNDSFANIGTPQREGVPFDFGRSRGAVKVMKDQFNCTGEFSDAEPMACSELRFIKRFGDDLIGAFKVPGIRNVTATAPYMHAGQFRDLDEVMEHYNKAPAPPFGHSMLTRLDLEQEQLDKIVRFMESLDSEIDAEPQWLKAPEESHTTTQTFDQVK